MLYKNILVAVDDSSTSELALKEAIRYVNEAPQTNLRIVHVGDEFFVNWDGQPVLPNELHKTFKNSELALLQNIATELRTAHVGNFETRLIESDKLGAQVPERIVQEAKAWPADLIIIGTHGRRGFHHFLLGSVAEGVARISPIPVLLVRGALTG